MDIKQDTHHESFQEEIKQGTTQLKNSFKLTEIFGKPR